MPSGLNARAPTWDSLDSSGKLATVRKAVPSPNFQTRMARGVSLRYHLPIGTQRSRDRHERTFFEEAEFLARARRLLVESESEDEGLPRVR
ncbi:hypothetical protein [Coleofasciculus sp. H7-2]|uniref:hypothetical protein n=1 Tax=Coleofasciculus sp. H7-2 TaxID=3351545 RepID=UPI00366B8392